MPREYSPRQFFRQVPKALLQRYFASQGLLTDFDWKAVSERKIDLLYDAWRDLAQADRDRAETDFREVHALACEGGIRAILDEALFHGHPADAELSTRLAKNAEPP